MKYIGKVCMLFILGITSLSSFSKDGLDGIRFFSVYSLSPKTTAIVINQSESEDDYTSLDKAFIKIEEADSIHIQFYSNLYENKVFTTLQYYDTTGVYKLLTNSKIVEQLSPLVEKKYYVYGTKGYSQYMTKDITIALDECMTNIFALPLEYFDPSKNGYPILATTEKLDIVYGKNYKDAESKINQYFDNIEADYKDKMSVKVFANIGDIYVAYSDDFKWHESIEKDTDCFFPSRILFKIEPDKSVQLIWSDGLDLYGIPCD